jgi:hypothetical protein
MYEIKALKEKLKKKNANNRDLKKKLIEYKNENNKIRDWLQERHDEIRIYQKLLPIKFYKITYEVHLMGKIIDVPTTLIRAHHPLLAIEIIRNATLEGHVELLDILEVAS